MAETEYDWIFDYIMGFFNSPEWDASVMHFVDEHCVNFQNEDENQFQHTEIHEEFKQHVDTMLSSRLQDLGITDEMFVEACEKARNSRPINRDVFEKLTAMDDFLTFKKLMVKRNMELDLEAARAIQAQEQKQQEMERADAQPDSDHEDDDDGVGDEDDDDDGAGTGLTEEGRQLASLLELEMLHRKEHMEQLELEQALAVSLAMEEARLQQADKKGPGAAGGGAKEGTEEDADEAEAVSAKAGPHTPPSHTARLNVTPASADASERSPMNFRSEDALAASSPRDGGGGKDAELDEDDDDAAEANAAVDAPPNRRKQDDTPIASIAVAPKPTDKRPKSLMEMAREYEFRRAQAAQILEENKTRAQEREETRTEIAKTVNVTEEQAAERARHMREQRDRIMRKKQREREELIQRRKQEQQQDLEAKRREWEARMRSNPASGTVVEDVEDDEDAMYDFGGGPSSGSGRQGRDADAKGGGSSSFSPPRRAAAGDGLRGGAKGEDRNPASPGGTDTAEVDRRRGLLHTALAKQMKLGLLEQQQERLVRLQEDQFAELDNKLRLVQSLREDNRNKEHELVDAVQQQQNMMHRNAQRSATINRLLKPTDEFEFHEG